MERPNLFSTTIYQPLVKPAEFRASRTTGLETAKVGPKMASLTITTGDFAELAELAELWGPTLHGGTINFRMGSAIKYPWVSGAVWTVKFRKFRTAAPHPSLATIDVLARPRLAPPSLAQVTARLREVPWDSAEIERSDLLAFYHPDTLRHLTSLRQELLKRAPLDQANPDPVDDWIRAVSLNRLTGHSPGFFSVYTLPPNQAVTVHSQIKINEKRNQVPPPRDVIEIILKKTRTLLKDGLPPAHPPANLGVGPANASYFIPSGSVSLVVTSPPFLDIVRYDSDNWLRCWFAGTDLNSVAIGMHRTETAWTLMVREVLIEQARLLRPGGHIAFEVGEVRGGKVLLERLVWEAVEGLPFDLLAVLVNQQEFTKTANCWGVSNNSSGTNTNRIVILRRTHRV
jgi:hypothetical protein